MVISDLNIYIIKIRPIVDNKSIWSNSLDIDIIETRSIVDNNNI